MDEYYCPKCERVHKRLWGGRESKIFKDHLTYYRVQFDVVDVSDTIPEELFPLSWKEECHEIMKTLAGIEVSPDGTVVRVNHDSVIDTFKNDFFEPEESKRQDFNLMHAPSDVKEESDTKEEPKSRWDKFKDWIWNRD